MGGHGFHFCERPQDTMPYFYNAFGCKNFKLGIIETYGKVVKGERKQFVTDEFKLLKVLTHVEVIELIKTFENIKSRFEILEYYYKNMTPEEIYSLKEYIEKDIESVIKHPDTEDGNWINYLFYSYAMKLCLERAILHNSHEKADSEEMMRIKDLFYEWGESEGNKTLIHEFIKKYLQINDNRSKETLKLELSQI